VSVNVNKHPCGDFYHTVQVDWMKVIIAFNNLFLCTAAVFFLTCSGAQHFNDLAVNEEKESVDVVPYLNLKTGESAADLGAGGGYFSFKLAGAVGQSGTVYAVDIDPESVSFIENTARARGISNVLPVLASYEDSKLGSGSVDLVFIRNAYHDFQDRVRYFRKLKSSLKQGGRIVIIDYEPSKLGFFRKLFGHAINENEIISEMKQAGYIKQKSYMVLEKQSFNVFVPE
jgi:arsenite methyltransferase